MNSKEQPIDVIVVKRLWNHQLEPVKVMLVHKKKDLKLDEWLRFVEVTRNSILQHPDQYLVNHFDSKELVHQLVNKIFNDFLVDMKD